MQKKKDQSTTVSRLQTGIALIFQMDGQKRPVSFVTDVLMPAGPQWGVTPPASTRPPSAADVTRNGAFLEQLRALPGLFLSDAEAAERAKALAALKEMAGPLTKLEHTSFLSLSFVVLDDIGSHPLCRASETLQNKMLSQNHF